MDYGLTKLVRVHQVDDDVYRAGIRDQLSTVVMSQAYNPKTFVESYKTLLMAAKFARLESGATSFVSCRDVTTTFEANGVQSQDSPKRKMRRTLRFCYSYSMRMCQSYNVERTRDSRV
jgi:hypothetical protein